jgi:hypothetical protein
MQRRRGKRKRYSKSDIQRTRAVKAEKWEKRRMQTRKLRSRIVEFEKYDHGSFVSSYLWWDLITKGARGDDLFEVRNFHERHPGWDYQAFRDPASSSDTVFDATGSEPMIDSAGHEAMNAAAEDLASSMASPNDELFFDAT